MLMLGTFFNPTIAATSGQKLPAALTTCSQIISPFSVITFHSPEDVFLISVTLFFLYILAPPFLAPLAIALVVLVGSV